MAASEDAKIDKLLGLTSGVIMIVGPTGSGKSSTMYTLVRELLSDRTNLITLEDPVEYHIKGATQVQINEKVGLTFASGLRAAMRQDPDIILINTMGDSKALQKKFTRDLISQPAWQQLKAAKTGRVHFLPPELFLYMAGSRYPEAFLHLAKLLHPGKEFSL